MYRIIGKDGQQYGPVTADQLRGWIVENRVNAQTMARAEGDLQWKPLSLLAEFAAELKPPAGAAANPPTFTTSPSSANPRASNKLPAGICGILLGSLGVHKFILGYTGPGLIMLLVSLVGFCAGGAAVMGVIGLVEGVIYLTKSDEEFVRAYVDGRKEWF
ncbi:MAG: GYF domain-containing protein [Verrucomicrobiota bacterium]